jgi:hypothetical protein
MSVAPQQDSGAVTCAAIACRQQQHVFFRGLVVSAPLRNRRYICCCLPCVPCLLHPQPINTPGSAAHKPIPRPYMHRTSS